MDQQPARQLSSTLYFALIFLLILALSSAGLSAEPVQATTFKLPPNHHSTYLIEKYDTVVGEMKNDLNYENGVIHYQSTATAKGLASLFIGTDPSESSVLNWPDNKQQALPRQQSYDYIQEKQHKKNQHMVFNYTDDDKALINGSYKNKDYYIESEQPVWARQFLPLLMSSDLQLNPNITEHSFLITNKGRMQKYTYTLEGDETLEFNNKKLAVKKFKITKKDSRRMSYAWLSRTHYYLPIKIEQYKDDELNGRLILTHLKLK